jgi:hypothetical protein
MAEHAVACARLRARTEFERIELEAAGDADAGRDRAEIDKSTRRLFALHAEAIDIGQHVLHEPTHEPVARI